MAFAENADGLSYIRPIASHNFRICDYTTYQGMLVMTGIDLIVANGNPRCLTQKHEMLLSGRSD
jgi:hypothetical protein